MPRRVAEARSEAGPSSPPAPALRRRTIARGARIVLRPGFANGQLQYAAPITFGDQSFYVQLDTGSSDLWVASTSCNTASCRPKNGNVPRYNAGTSTAQATNHDLSITYLAGSASGPILTTNVNFGGANVPHQAFAAASDVQSQQLGSMGVSGILGLALPANSLIQQTLEGEGSSNRNNSQTDPSLTGNLLPGLWNNTIAGSRYFSIGLQRLPSDGGNGQSSLTFGGVDQAYLSTPAQFAWQAASADGDGVTRKWTSLLTQLLVTVNGTDVPIPLPAISGAFPKAIWDTGAAFNYATPAILNALYGAYGIGPADDGSRGYYVPCDLLVQITLVINGRSLWTHPLDNNLRGGQGPGATSSGCFASFQPLLSDNPPADMVLGAPFMRSVPTAYSCDSILENPPPGVATTPCDRPQIGVFSPYENNTSREAARDQFHRVRVLGQSLGDNSKIEAGVGLGNNDETSSRGLSSGARIAIGVVVGLVVILFVMAGAVLFYKRRRARKNGAGAGGRAGEKEQDDPFLAAQNVSAKERAAQRELLILHGQLPEEVIGSADGDQGNSLAAPTADWDTGSKGYWEARAVANDWKRRQRDEEEAAAGVTGLSGNRGSGSSHASNSDTRRPSIARMKSGEEEYEMSDAGSTAALQGISRRHDDHF